MEEGIFKTPQSFNANLLVFDQFPERVLLCVVSCPALRTAGRGASHSTVWFAHSFEWWSMGSEFFQWSQLGEIDTQRKNIFSVYINTYIYLGDVYIKMFMAALTVKERW